MIKAADDFYKMRLAMRLSIQSLIKRISIMASF